AHLFPADQHHRDRRLGRNARGVAEPVTVQHHVADHQHARLPDVQARHAFTPHALPIGKYSKPSARTMAGSYRFRPSNIAAVFRVFFRAPKSGDLTSAHSVTIASASQPCRASVADSASTTPLICGFAIGS